MNCLIDTFFRHYENHPDIISMVVAGLVLGVDYLTGKYVQFPQIEKYVAERSSAKFSHGICEECAKKMYPEFYKDKQ